jgi:hypothetical protein
MLGAHEARHSLSRRSNYERLMPFGLFRPDKEKKMFFFKRKRFFPNVPLKGREASDFSKCRTG